LVRLVKLIHESAKRTTSAATREALRTRPRRRPRPRLQARGLTE
jgi:hypothetical protein